MNIISRIKDAWRALVRPPEPVVPAGTVSDNEVIPGLPWGYVTRGMSESIPRGEYRIPEALPGVRPAKMPALKEHGGTVRLAMDEQLATDDASVSGPAAWGIFNQGSLGPGLAFLGFPYLAELTQISEYRTPAESLSTEMTRRWGKIKNRGEGDLKQKIKDLTDDVETFGLRAAFRQAALKCEWFGRSHVAINIKGQYDDDIRQLPLVEIGKNMLESFVVIEPYWMTPYSWNSTIPSRPDFYKPQSWFEMGRKTHSSRYLTFIFREVPDLLKPAYDFAGISITQLMMPYVNRWLRTAKNVNDLINIFSVVTLATDMGTNLQLPADHPKSVQSRLKAFTMLRDNRGAMVVNKSTEELTMQNVPLGSLDKLQAQAQEHMATPARMTLLKFFGITPTGLNATGEEEKQSWNDYVHAMQELGMTIHMDRALTLLQMNRYGKADPDLVWEWIPLDEPSGKELAEINKAKADRAAVNIQNAITSNEEERQALRDDPLSGYSALTGPAPEPQEMSEDPQGTRTPDGDDKDEPGKKDKSPAKASKDD